MLSLGCLFGPDQVLYRIIYGQTDRQESKNQGKQGKFNTFDNLVKLDPAEYPCKYDRDHLKSNAGVFNVTIWRRGFAFLRLRF